MAYPTELILSKYYGFGADPKNKKFLSSHDGTYDRTNYHRRSSLSDASVLTERTEVASGQGTNSETVKDEMENSSPGNSAGNIIIRSSRAIQNDDTFDDVLSDINGYEHFVESPDCPNEGSPCKEKKTSTVVRDLPMTGKLEKNDDKDKVMCNDSSTIIGQFDEILSDNVSDISSNPTQKKPKIKSVFTRTSTKASSKPAGPPRPKILPACNGVFLDLTNLFLAEFPLKILNNIPNLRMLYLENNSLTTLPEELFSSLKLLQWLDVRNNKLSTLPRNIKYHTCLETILLEGNLFEKLPLELCLIPSLKALQTSRNPVVFPPADILALGFAATINYLRCEWNKLNPESPAVESPKKNRKMSKTTILCSEPPILRTISKSSRLFGSSSTGHVTEGARNISVRKKSINYRPSNRCENQDRNAELEAQLLEKVKEMLTKQAVTLQKMKDEDALREWRQNRKSYEKSMSKAANRTEEDIPFGIDIRDIGVAVLGIKSAAPPKNINDKLSELHESLNRLHETRKSETLSPKAVQKLLENEIKKISEMQEEIQNLRRYNETATEPFEGSEQPCQPYKPPPSIII